MYSLPDCIIVAAGRSSRMGSWKPGLPWGEDSVVSSVAGEASNAGCRVIVVGGYRYSILTKLLKGMNGVETVRSLRWRVGMDMSVRTGLCRLKSRMFFVVPGDMPLLESHDYRLLYDRAVAGGEFDACRPIFKGRPGHPVLFSERMRKVLEMARPGKRIREQLAERNVMMIEWQNSGVLEDIDTPEDYERVIRFAGVSRQSDSQDRR